MAILELTLYTPTLVGERVSSGQLRTLAATAWVREFSPGTRKEDITDDRWNHRSHSWWLSVRRDGIAVLEIKPEWKRSEIQVMHHNRPQRLYGATYMLDRPIVQLLAGSQTVNEDGDKVAMLFKMICRTNDKTFPF